MRHVSKMSLARVAGQSEDFPAASEACGAEWTGPLVIIWPDVSPESEAVRSGEAFDLQGGIMATTCPTCRVLLDAALEQRDVAALLRAVAAP